ncbi:hypothetical protein GC177_02870 [bacterium]|nr:hypothetical protein [bacterium]
MAIRTTRTGRLNDDVSDCAIHFHTDSNTFDLVIHVKPALGWARLERENVEQWLSDTGMGNIGDRLSFTHVNLQSGEHQEHDIRLQGLDIRELLTITRAARATSPIGRHGGLLATQAENFTETMAYAEIMGHDLNARIGMVMGEMRVEEPTPSNAVISAKTLPHNVWHTATEELSGGALTKIFIAVPDTDVLGKGNAADGSDPDILFEISMNRECLGNAFAAQNIARNIREIMGLELRGQVTRPGSLDADNLLEDDKLFASISFEGTPRQGRMLAECYEADSEVHFNLRVPTSSGHQVAEILNMLLSEKGVGDDGKPLVTTEVAAHIRSTIAEVYSPPDIAGQVNETGSDIPGPPDPAQSAAIWN